MTRRDALFTMLSGSVLVRPLLASAVPDRTVVLSFDDAASSHYHFVAPLLRKYGFGGTFFVCEFPPDFDDKKKYLTWEQIKELQEQGFEIGSHTWIHTHVSELTQPGFIAQLKYVEDKLQELNNPRPVSFAYPAYATNGMSLQVLAERGYKFARAGGSRTYKPNVDNPLLIPANTSLTRYEKAEPKHHVAGVPRRPASPTCRTRADARSDPASSSSVPRACESKAANAVHRGRFHRAQWPGRRR